MQGSVDKEFLYNWSGVPADAGLPHFPKRHFILFSEIPSSERCIGSYNRGELNSHKYYPQYIDVEDEMD